MSGAFKLLKTAASSSDNFSSAFKALKGLDNLSTGSSLLKKIDFKSISGTFSTAASTTKRTSSLADTAGFVKKFSNAIPSSTDDVLSSVGSKVKSVGDDIISISRIDTNPKFIKNIANTNSLSRLKKISVSISSSTPKVSSISRRSSTLLEKADNVKVIGKNIPKINKVDDVASALKNGKGVTKKLDNVGDAGKFTTKNADKAGKTSKTLKKLNKGAEFIADHGDKVQLAILGFFFLGMAFKTNSGDIESDEDPLILVTDPSSDVYEVALYSSPVITEESSISLKDTLLQKEIMIAFMIKEFILIVL